MNVINTNANNDPIRGVPVDGDVSFVDSSHSATFAKQLSVKTSPLGTVIPVVGEGEQTTEDGEFADGSMEKTTSRANPGFASSIVVSAMPPVSLVDGAPIEPPDEVADTVDDIAPSETTTESQGEIDHDSHCATLIIQCNFGDGVAAAESSTEPDDVSPDEAVILPFPSAFVAAPKSLVDVFSAQSTSTESRLPEIDIEPDLPETTPREMSTDVVSLPASFARALSSADSVVTDIPPAEIAIEHSVPSRNTENDSEVAESSGPRLLEFDDDVADVPIQVSTSDVTDTTIPPAVTQQPKSSTAAEPRKPQQPKDQPASSVRNTSDTADANSTGSSTDDVAAVSIDVERPSSQSDESSPADDTGVIPDDIRDNHVGIAVDQNARSPSLVVPTTPLADIPDQMSNRKPAAGTITDSDAGKRVTREVPPSEQTTPQPAARPNSGVAQHETTVPEHTTNSPRSRESSGRTTTDIETAQPVTPPAVGEIDRAVADKEINVAQSVETTTKGPVAAADDTGGTEPVSSLLPPETDASSLPAAKSSRPAPTNTVVRVPESLNPAHQLDRLASLVQQSERYDRTISVRLHPVELGTLQIDVTERNGVMSARFEVQSQLAQKILGDSLPKLHEALSQLGARVERIDVQLVTAETSRDRSGYGHSEQQQSRQREQSTFSGGDRQDLAGQDRQSSQSSSRDEFHNEQYRHDPPVDATEQSAANPQPTNASPRYRPLDRIDIHI
ncbi:MAG: flagellar hook-length control protein FliK [Planctomycetota bacterium]|nr:flagellar hook-length control protein FliK [Planctomycetota bacterium]